MSEFIPKELPIDIEISSHIYKKLISASRALSELNGFAKIIPNRNILINSLVLQEAKDSSEIENIITTHDELFLVKIDESKITQEAKEVQNYELALKKGFDLIKKDKLLLNSHILKIQELLERNNAGFRKQLGTILKNPNTGEIRHIPPQHYDDISRLMTNLERYINDDSLQDFDPLIKMAIIHYQFESIHPFYDGNGRTGRIINILYLVYKGFLDMPILYLSGYIVKNKEKYYHLIQEIHDNNAWEKWILYILDGIEKTAKNTIVAIKNIKDLMKKASKTLQEYDIKIYNKDFIEALFIYPYTKIDFITKKLNITRQTASKYLKICEKLKILRCIKLGRINYYVNIELFELFKKGIC